jgi:hypothetical protein
LAMNARCHENFAGRVVACPAAVGAVKGIGSLAPRADLDLHTSCQSASTWLASLGTASRSSQRWPLLLAESARS